MSETATADRTAHEGTARTLAFAVLVSFVCSVLVASAAVLLKPRQLANARLEQQRHILSVAELWQPGAGVDELFRDIEIRLVELESGAYRDDLDAAQFDMREAAADPERGVAVPPALDRARIGRRARLAPVYQVREAGQVKRIILPIHGAGLWSTIYGFIALESDATTVAGIRFYEHAETPGLGDQIDDPQWQRQWRGKRIAGASGELRLEIVKGRVRAGDPRADFRIDGLSGATLTSRGVNDILQYWLGAHGFGPFLERLRHRGAGQ